ncbi:hypothetical protein [Streptomyces sp. NBC_00096]|uniref:hypothetical protein n=1 Tax=Streptomyces sp. NBC_00096 TaxID=2975650 RepID=UPI003252DC79
MPKQSQPTMTHAEMSAIVPAAQEQAADAALAVAEAEAVIRGEAPGTPATPEALAQLRLNAEYAGMRVTAAERQLADEQNARRRAEQAAALARVQNGAARDLGQADSIIAALDGCEGAVAALCTALAAHNARLSHWATEMGNAGIAATHGEGAGPEGFGYSEDCVTVGTKVYRPMQAGVLLGALLHRALADYPRHFRYYTGTTELADRCDLIDSNGTVDLHDLIRKDA